MRLAPVVLLGALASCGDDASQPDAQPGHPCDTGACLTSIDDEADWAAVSEPHTGTRCDFADETKYIAPATASAALRETIYQDVAQNRFHVEFLRTVLADYFPGLTPDQYAVIVQRRATREYWGGAIARVVDADGNTVGYGFDVIVDQADPAEEVTEAEVEAIHALLSGSFHLPLGYAPRTSAAIAAAQGFSLTFDVHLPRSCAPPADCDDPTASCIVIPAPVTLCGQFVDNRPIAEEYALKTQVTLPAGEWLLPDTDGATLPMTLVGDGLYSQARTPITGAPGEVSFRDDFDIFEYTQVLTAGADTIELSTQFYGTPPVRIEITPETLGQGFYGLYGSANGGVGKFDGLHLEACSYPQLEDWSAIGTLAGGDGFRLRYRYAQPAAGSSPVSFMSASVTLGGVTVLQDDYFQLVYAGLHHNFDNQWWVLFDEPITYLGHDVHGLWVDAGNYDWDPADGVYTLDADRMPLDTLTIVDYTVAAD